MSEQHETRFEVGDWVHTKHPGWGLGTPDGELWTGARRVVRVSGDLHLLLCGAPNFFSDARIDIGWSSTCFRHATPEEVEAREVRDDEWAVCTGSAVFLGDFQGGTHGGTHRGDPGCTRGVPICRHATPEEYRAAEAAAEAAAEEADEAPDDALLDSRDELIPPTEEELRLEREIERLMGELREERTALDGLAIQFGACERERNELAQELARLESALVEACAARDAALAPPERPPMLWDRITGEGPFIAVNHTFVPGVLRRFEPVDAFFRSNYTAYYSGSNADRSTGHHVCSSFTFRWPDTLTPVEPPRLEVRLSPVPEVPAPEVPSRNPMLSALMVVVLFSVLTLGIYAITFFLTYAIAYVLL